MTTKAHGAPKFKAWDRSGNPLAGGKAFFYEAGTTTLKATYADANGAAANTNPVVLDAAGEATVFFGAGRYTVRVEDSAGVLQWEVDGFDPQVIDVPGPSVNLVDNGSFELDTDADGVPDGWVLTAYPGGTADTERYHADTNPAPDVDHGEAALRFVSPGGAGGGGGYADQAEPFEVAEGEDLDVALRLKATDAALHNKVDVRWFDAAGAALGTQQTTVYDEAAAGPTAWAEVRARITPPAGARLAKVRLYGGVNDTVTAGTTRFDHVRVRPVQPQYLRSDGDDQTAGSLTAQGGALASEGTIAYLKLRETDGPADEQRWAFMASAGNLYLLAVRDDEAADQTVMSVARTGTTIDQVDFPAPSATVRVNGNRVLTVADEGAGGGLDADTVDGIEAAQLVRADAADQVDGVLTFSQDLRLNNGVSLISKSTAGTPVGIVQVNGVNQAVFGNAVLPTELKSSGSLTHNGQAVWHAGNDGPASGLDADTVDGLHAADLAPAGHSHVAAEGTAVNPSDVVLDAVGGVVTSVSLGTLQAGQRLLVTGRLTMTKGAVAGLGTIALSQTAGTAAVADLTGLNFAHAYSNMPASADHRFYLTAVFKVTTPGTLTLSVSGASVGSDSTVYAGEGLVGATVLNL